MRIVRLGLLGVPLLAMAGCGGSKNTTPTLSVSCNGSLSLAGAASVSVMSAPGGSGAVLTFPDPANTGSTGNLPVPAGQACVITPVIEAPPAKAGAT